MKGEKTESKTKFYNSVAWRKLARYYAGAKNWTCENCKNKNVDRSVPLYAQLHAHHKTPITDSNLSNVDISLNEKNLILLCRACHNAVHGENEVIAPGLYFDEAGQLQKR